MPQRPLSIYRGYSTNRGIGETPATVPGSLRGEQYLLAEGELWQAEIADAARRWMTLYDDQRTATISHRLGERIEGWAYFDCGDLRFLVRLVAAGIFDSRLAYFSHGQVWHKDDFHNGNDPGALLGGSRAFHPSWRDGQTIQETAAIQPGTDWKQAVEAKPKMAVRLLAYLYRACITGIPVVVGAPYTEFVTGGSIHQFVCFARAALPLELKRDCRIRIFTGRPEPYLKELKAHLVVVPEELAAAALSTRPDAALMDSNGEVRAGAEFDSSYTGYAKEVVERALKFPDYLLAFSERYQRFLDRSQAKLDQPPDEAAVASASVIYNLTYANGNRDKLNSLLPHIAEEARQRGGKPRDWANLIDQDEWKGFSRDLLVEETLAPWSTDDIRALRQCMKKELAHREFEFTKEECAILREGTPANLREAEAQDLVDYGLVGFRPEDLEIKTREQWQSVLEQTRRYPRYRKSLDDQAEKWVKEGKLPYWLTENDVLPVVTNNTSAANLENYLTWSEVLAALKSKEAKLRAHKLFELKGREERRRLFHLWKENRWTVLQGFDLQPSWDKDVADLLLDAPEELCKLEPDRLLRLKANGELHPNMVRALDHHMQRDPQKTTNALLQADCWLQWRLCLGLASYRAPAKEWLQAPGERHLEDWTIVVADLEVPVQSDDGKTEFGLTGGDLRKLRERFKDGWPFPRIALFEQEQVEDIIHVCADFEALAELAEAINPDHPRYVQVFQKSAFAQRFPEDILLWLTPKAINPLPGLTLVQATELVQLSGPQREPLGLLGGRRGRTVIALCQPVIENLLEHLEEATAAADWAKLWGMDKFRDPFANWMCDQRLDPNVPAQRQILEILNAKVVPGLTAPVSNRDEDLKGLAELYLQSGLRSLAEFLWPKLGDPAVYSDVVAALTDGKSQAPVWNKLVARVRARKESEIRSHPLIAIADRIMNLQKSDLRQIDDHGWPTLKRALASTPDSIHLLYACGELLPILHLAAVLRDDDGLGAVGAGLLTLYGADSFFDRPVWFRALVNSLKRCQRRSGNRRGERLELAIDMIFNACDALVEDPRQIREVLFATRAGEAPPLPSQSNQAQGAPA